MIVLLACLLGSGLFAGDKGIFPFELHQDTLPNGLQVVTVPFESPGLVAFTILVRVGSRDEVEPGKSGFAHFFEHCMFRGTERFSSEDYGRVMQEMAASGNADTWYDRTYYYFTGNANNLEKMFDVESDRFRNLKYPEHGFKTEAGAVLGEYTKNFASPYRRYFERLQNIAFKKHTYGHTTMGYLKDIKDMPNQYEYSLRFYDQFYRPEYCTVIISGDVTHDQVMGLTKKYFGDWERGSYVPDIPQEPKQTAPISDHVTYDGQTNYVGIYYKSPAFSDTNKDKLALDLLISLYFSSNSDIYRELVIEKQKVRSFSLSTVDTRDPMFVGVFASLFDVEDTPMVRKRIEQAYRSMVEKPIDADKLESIKSRWKYSLVAQLDRPVNVAESLANYIWLTGDPNTLNRYYAMLETVTVDDLKAAAKKYFVKSGRINLTLSAEETAR